MDLLQPTPTQAYRHILTVVLQQLVTDYCYSSNKLCLLPAQQMAEAGTVPAGTATGAPDDAADAATQVLAVATIVQI